MAVTIDAYGACLSRYGEEFCGDQVKIIRSGQGVAAMLADGMGGGAKAGPVSSFAVKIMSTMIESGMPLRQAADMIAESQPSSGGQGRIAFTLVLALFDGNIYVEQYETPDLILLRRGRTVSASVSCRTVQGGTLRSGTLAPKQADTILAVGSGMLAAGADRDLKNGWGLETVGVYLKNAYTPRVPAEKLVRLVLAAGNSLSLGRPKNDLSAMAFRIKPVP